MFLSDIHRENFDARLETIELMKFRALTKAFRDRSACQDEASFRTMNLLGRDLMRQEKTP